MDRRIHDGNFRISGVQPYCSSFLSYVHWPDYLPVSAEAQEGGRGGEKETQLGQQAYRRSKSYKQGHALKPYKKSSYIGVIDRKYQKRAARGRIRGED